MQLELFSERTVGEFYESVVAVPAERRIFNIPAEDLCAGSVREHVDNIITMFCPGRLLVDTEICEAADCSSGSDTARETVTLHMWLEFSGSVRLFSLRPRQHYTTPPIVTRLQPQSGGASGQVIIQKSIRSASDIHEYQRFVEQQFRAVRDCVQWVNDDLDYYEQGLRNWLWSLLETKRNRLFAESRAEVQEQPY